MNSYLQASAGERSSCKSDYCAASANYCAPDASCAKPLHLTHPASNYLIPEGEARPNFGSLVIGGLLLSNRIIKPP